MKTFFSRDSVDCGWHSHVYHYALAVAAALVGMATPMQLGAQTTPHNERLQVGFIGAGTLNMHKGNFTTYDGILECGTFDEATTVGWQAGNILDVPLSPMVALSARLYYHKANGDFTTPNPVQPNVSLDDGTLVRLTTEHTLATALDYVMLDAIGKWRVLPPLYVGAGPSVGLATRAAYEQEETILSPRGMKFANGESTRNIIAGNFDEQGTRNTQRNLRLAATGVIGADIAISDNFVLNPEVGYTFGITNVLSTFDWKVHALRAGIALKYSFSDEQEPVIIRETEPAPPFEPPPAPEPIAALDVVNQLADGTRQNYAEIAITEEQTLDVVPLLPYVFFAANSNTLPPRYAQLDNSATAQFDEANLRDSTLALYHHVLNIIGSRMRAHPDAHLEITGCREPLDDTGNNEQLALERANTVQQYLASVWNIEPSRLHVHSRVLPQAISNRSIEDGREENRRVEMASDNPHILAPIRRTLVQRDIQPAALVLVPRVQFGENTAGWRVSLNDATTDIVWESEGSGIPSGDVAWHIQPSAVVTLPAPTALTALLSIWEESGKSVYASREVPVRKIVRAHRFTGELVRDSVLERYALMFFDFNTPNVSEFNNKVLQLVQSRMRTTSSVRITGLTDRIGAEDYNKKLSQQRAQTIAENVRARIVPERLSAEGAGELLLYNNDLPEGRFYNRTVIVEIATPVEQ